MMKTKQMNPKKQHRIILNLRRIIPVMQCKPGCHDCCGIVPMTFWERKMMCNGDKTNMPSCEFLTESGCSNYPERPMLCRIYGAINRKTPDIVLRAGNAGVLSLKRLHCPRGCGPEFPLSWDIAADIMETYREIQPKVWMDGLNLNKR